MLVELPNRNTWSTVVYHTRNMANFWVGDTMIQQPPMHILCLHRWDGCSCTIVALSSDIIATKCNQCPDLPRLIPTRTPTTHTAPHRLPASGTPPPHGLALLQPWAHHPHSQKEQRKHRMPAIGKERGQHHASQCAKSIGCLYLTRGVVPEGGISTPTYNAHMCGV